MISTSVRMLSKYYACAFLCTILVLSVTSCGSESDNRIFFNSDRDGNLEIYESDLGGEQQTNLTNSPVDESSPKLSPDGRYLAYLIVTETMSAIELIRVDGSSKTQLTSSNTKYRNHSWSPESDRIVYVREDEIGSRLFTIDIEGSEPVLITSIVGVESSDWSHDGSLIAFSVGEGELQGIYVRNPEGVNEIRITNTPDHNPVFSPNSKQIAFMSTRDDNPELYVIDTDGSDQIRITSTDAPEYQFSWSPDGKKLVFVSERDGNPEIYVTDRKGETQTRLTHNTVRDDEPGWSLDGKRIAFVSYLDADGEIIIMDADGTNQERVTNNKARDSSPTW